MPPFAATPPAMLQLNILQPPADDELDSPVESISNMSLDDEATDSVKALPKPTPLKLARPDFNERSSTDPSPTALLQGYFASPQQRPTTSGGRNRSPYSRSHLRSKSGGSSLLSAPVMTRAHSMPNPNISRTIETAPATPSSGSLSPGAPHSPMRSPRRVHSPFRQQQEEGYAPPRSPSFASAGAIESIQEDSELDITPRAAAASNTLPPPAALASFSRSGSLRRRPASPLHSLANAPPQQQTPHTSFPVNITDNNATPIHTSALSSASSSPFLGPQTRSSTSTSTSTSDTRFSFNEAYPTLHHYASNSSFSSMPSMPSTPTSARSRSPSISSLDTIEDEPDLESEAIEHERIQRLKLAAERQERLERGEDPSADDGGVVGGGVRRRSSLDVPRTGFGRTGGGGGGGGSSSREKKRWSICGGERRGDLDLETIWED
ncbi:hypothetical protein LTR85_001389 [Meristemomyces frigidus]|nr:hypothetical protein LTR85_001389 [Meristemomyces frigidus]